MQKGTAEVVNSMVIKGIWNYFNAEANFL